MMSIQDRIDNANLTVKVEMKDKTIVKNKKLGQMAFRFDIVESLRRGRISKVAC
mgnify:CR=1 FL=1